MDLLEQTNFVVVVADLLDMEEREGFILQEDVVFMLHHFLESLKDPDSEAYRTSLLFEPLFKNLQYFLLDTAAEIPQACYAVLEVLRVCVNASDEFCKAVSRHSKFLLYCLELISRERGDERTQVTAIHLLANFFSSTSIAPEEAQELLKCDLLGKAFHGVMILNDSEHQPSYLRSLLWMLGNISLDATDEQVELIVRHDMFKDLIAQILQKEQSMFGDLMKEVQKEILVFASRVLQKALAASHVM